MKFIVSSTYLLKQLQVLGGVINNSNTLPILDNFLFELDHTKLTVSASDLETTMASSLDVESDSKGSVAIPARLLLDTLKTFPEQPLTFVIEDNNTVEISSNHGKYALAYADGNEFPKAVALEDPSKTVITGDVLATAISKTIFAAGNDDLRPVMSGVFFQFSTEGLTFVATDAHKLVKYTREDVKASQVAEFIMPKKPLNLLKGILAASEDDVTIEYNESNAKFTFENSELICRLIDGKYPNYEAVIPKENPNKLAIDRTQFLTCDYQGDDMQIGFNSRFLTEMLNNLTSDEVQLEMSMPNRAGILTPVDGLDEGEQITMLVMPVMLNN